MKARRSKLPKTWQGTPVVRGKGMNYKTHDKLVESKSLADWPGRGEFYLVVAENMSGFDEPHAFVSKTDATAYARSCGNGNCDHRVLRCSSALLVIATENDL